MPLQRLRIALRPLPCAALFLATACGDGAPADDVAGAQDDAADGDILFRSVRPALQPAFEDNMRRRDPTYDRWRSETLHEEAKPVLRGFLGFLLRGEGAPDPVFEGCTRLRPRDLEQIFDDGVVSVLRPVTLDAELRPPAELRELGRELAEPFGGAVLNEHFKIVRVDLEGEDAFETTALVHVEGAVDGGRVQLKMEWRLGWSVDAEEPPRIRWLRSISFEEVHARSPLFTDLTAHLFGSFPRFEQEFLHGVEHYQNRTDQRLGGAFLGMQGLAVADVDGDGRDDLYVTQQAALPNRLFLHGPDGRVVDATARSRLGILENTRSALFVDWDNDGDQDLMAAVGPGMLTATNDGSGVFGRFRYWQSQRVGDVYSISAADADGDGDLDAYCCRYAEQGLLYGVPTPYHDANNGATNIFYRNDDGTFEEATDEFGFGSNNRKFSLASVWEDFDDDGDLDLYVVNDFGRNNLFRNEGGRFEDVASQVGADDMAAGMGVSVGDFDLDGDMDIYVTNMFSSAGLRIVPQSDLFMGGDNLDVHGHYQRHARGNTLLANRGDGTFEDATLSAGVSVAGWAWGARFVDFNNDGLEDVYSPNGFVTNRDPDDV